MTEVDNGMSDVAAIVVDGIHKSLVFKLATLAPECDSAIWVSNDGLGGFKW